MSAVQVPPVRTSSGDARTPGVCARRDGNVSTEATLGPSSSDGARRSSSTVALVDVRASLIAFAGFGAAPASLWAAPAYALRVVLRRRVLVDGLRRARSRSSPDVGVYEASLRTADEAAVRKGVLFATLLGVLVALGACTVCSVLAGR